MKRLFSFLLCLCLLAGLLPVQTLAAEPGATGGTWGGIDWTLDADGTLTITPTKNEITKKKPYSETDPKEFYRVGEVPAAVNDAISAIAGWPFDREAVKKLVIEEGVTSIGSFALQRLTNLTGEVVIPSTVIYIGQETFQNSPMTKLTFASGGTEELCIGPGAFKTLAIKELKLPADRPVHLHCWAFNGCAALENITLPASITKFSGWTHAEYCGMDWVDSRYAGSSDVFSACAKLKTVTFGSEEVETKFNNAQGNANTLRSLGVETMVKTLKMVEDPTPNNAVTYGTKLSDAVLTVGWTWADPDIVPTVGNTAYQAYYIAADTDKLDWTYNPGWNDTEQRIERTVLVDVLPRAITVSVEDSEIYVGEWPEYSYVVEGLLDGDELIAEPGYGTSADFKKPGVYYVYPDGADAGPNYDISYVEGKLTVKEISAPAKPDYTVSVSNVINGIVSVSTATAKEGDTVTVTVVPNAGYSLGTLTVNVNGAAAVLTKVSDTVYTFKMPAANAVVAATFARVELSAADCDGGEECPAVDYTDLDAAAWYHDGVHYCVENGLMVGISSDKFAPEAAMTRASLVTVLWRMEGEPKAEQELSFRDVGEDEWYTGAIRWANAVGIVKGYSSRKFGPDDAVTREQMAAILYRYAVYKGEASVASVNEADGFVDWTSVSGWAETAVAWACDEGLLEGKENCGKLTLVPGDTATRAQTANIIYRYIENI